MDELSFDRPKENMIFKATDDGIYIINGWTVAIPKKDFLRYIEKLNRGELFEVDAGFFIDTKGELETLNEQQIILSHKDCKMILSPRELCQVMDLVGDFYELDTPNMFRSNLH